MKFKFLPIAVCLITLVSCTKIDDNKFEKTADVHTIKPLQKIISTPTLLSNNEYNTPDSSQNNKSLGSPEVFKLIFNNKTDLDGDGKTDELSVYIDENNLLTKFCVNGFENKYNFAYSSESGTEEVKIISLGNNRKAILVGTSIDIRETSNHVNFKVFQYNENEIKLLISDTELPINSRGNYKVSYIQSGYINFMDNATGFVAEYKYPPKNISFSETAKKSLEKFSDLNIENSIYPCLLKIQDLDNDKIDEIIYSKFIPGLLHNEALGIIEYTLKFKNGQYRLEQEVFRDWWSGLDIIKQMKIN